MNKITSLVLLLTGVALIGFGVHASNSIGSDFSKFFTGAPTEKSIWLLLGGVLLAAVGAGGLLTGSKSA